MHGLSGEFHAKPGTRPRLQPVTGGLRRGSGFPWRWPLSPTRNSSSARHHCRPSDLRRLPHRLMKNRSKSSARESGRSWPWPAIAPLRRAAPDRYNNRPGRSARSARRPASRRRRSRPIAGSPLASGSIMQFWFSPLRTPASKSRPNPATGSRCPKCPKKP